MSRNVLFGIGGSLVVAALLAAIYAPAGDKPVKKPKTRPAVDSPSDVAESPAAKAKERPAPKEPAETLPKGVKRLPRSPVQGGEAAILKALGEQTALPFVDTPLSDVIEFIEEKHHIPVVLDKKAMDDVGIAPDVPVTRNLRGVSLRSALRLILRDLGLTYMIQDEVLLITTPEAAESRLTTKIFDVSDLVVPATAYHYHGNKLPTTDFETPSPAAGGSFIVDMDSLINIITSSVQPTSWDCVGGPGPIAPYGDRFLILSQTQEVIGEIEDLLATLRSLKQRVPTVLVDVEWLWLDRGDYEKLTAGAKPGSQATLAVDAAVLQSLRRQTAGFRGRLVCTAGQPVYLAAGDRRVATVNVQPAGSVSGGGMGFQALLPSAGLYPVVAVPNAGAVLELFAVPDVGADSAVLHLQSTVTRWGKLRPPARIDASWGAAQRTETTVPTRAVPEARNAAAEGAQRTESIQTPGGKTSFPLDRANMPAQELGTTVRVPLGKPVLLGAMTFAPDGGAGLDKPGDNPKQFCLIATTTLVPGQPRCIPHFAPHTK